MKRTAIAAVLLLLVAATAVAAPPLRLGRDVVPVSQAVMLTLDPRADGYTGSTTIELEVRKGVPAFSLHAEQMKIGKVSIGGVAATAAEGPEETIVITPGGPLKLGRTAMTIEFSNEYDRTAVGLYKMLKKDEPYLFTQFQAVDARKAFPCFDEPGFKIPYQITGVVPPQYDMLSNTPVEEQKDVDGAKMIRFARTKPLPSYLLAMAVGTFDYVPVSGATVPTRIVTPKGSAGLTGYAAEVTPKLLAALEQYFGLRYPFEKLDLIAVPEYWAGAMENPGLITFRETILLLDPERATVGQRRSSARVIAHELAHMWFGDYVTMAWWDDFWLNEAFADWMGDKIAGQVFPEHGVALDELSSIQTVMNQDASPLTNAVRIRDAHPEEAMRNVGVAYNKGKAVISMFERWMGAEAFRAGVNRHMKAHAWGNATASDFWASLGRHVSAPMGTFIDQPGVPLISVERVGGNRVRLTQSRFARHGVTIEPKSWIVPVALRYSDGARTRVQTVLLDAPSKTFTLDAKKVEWVFPHADAAGYYRWRMDRDAVMRLAQHASERLTPAERIAFLGNASALLDAGIIRGNDYLEVLNRFSAEQQPEVLESLLSSLGKVRAALTEADEALFAAYVRRTLGPALERIGHTRQANESASVTALRPLLVSWLANVGRDPKVIAFVKDQAQKLMSDAAAADASIAGVVIAANARAGGDEKLFEEYRRRFESATVPLERSRYLTGLGSFADPAIREKALAYALTGAVRPTELFTIPFGYAGTDEGAQYVFEWTLKNYDTIVRRVPPNFRAGMPRMAGGCSEQRLEKARQFFLAEGRKGEGTERTLAQVEEQVRECAAFRAREGELIRSYLQKVP